MASQARYFPNKTGPKWKKNTKEEQTIKKFKHRLRFNESDVEGNTVGLSFVSGQVSANSKDSEQKATLSRITEQGNNIPKLLFPESLVRLFLLFLFILPECSWYALNTQGKISSLAFVALLQMWS